mgnify:CR=1 FL=1
MEYWIRHSCEANDIHYVETTSDHAEPDWKTINVVWYPKGSIIAQHTILVRESKFQQCGTEERIRRWVAAVIRLCRASKPRSRRCTAARYKVEAAKPRLVVLPQAIPVQAKATPPIPNRRRPTVEPKPVPKKHAPKKTKAQIEAEQHEEEERKELAALWAQGEATNFVPGRELMAAIRRIKSHRVWVANGSPMRSVQQEPWRNYGECVGGGISGHDDIDGVGSWGKHVRQWEDRDDE